MGELEQFYGIRLHAPSQSTLDEAIRQRLGKEQTVPGSLVRFGQIALRVRDVTPAGAVDQVGLVILPADAANPEKIG